MNFVLLVQNTTIIFSYIYIFYVAYSINKKMHETCAMIVSASSAALHRQVRYCAERA